ncbi:thermonuclease family protein [Nesterenkonia jeotgali]|uniref:Endonuclease YncB(Thermonuclease family) n=1 Tax=Nesterenkonia jeotgali TaxID=317018 RepID=A0A839FW31_9MICC|nr:thermonuclease family protein [Nesterenkonia jeotgali]MBA8922751.1 endonuclease YncB(thermonuclease family) [Nesterenkonia jeotgali]
MGAQKRSAWQRFKRWPVVLRVATLGCGGLIALFVLALIVAIVAVMLSPEGAEERAAETDEQELVLEESEEPEASEEPQESEEPSEEPTESETPPASPTRTATPTPSPTPSPTPAPSPSRTPTANPNEHTAVVVRIIDGDTVELDSGDTVRISGIDTPERGECHFDTASARMGELVLGKTVTLTRDREDTDRYDRILRYVDVDGTDAGITLIEEGLAKARYDSRDGYGFHTREPDYISADDGAPLQTCAPEPAPAPAPAPAPGQQGANCDPNYTPCIPAFPPDINCGDLDVSVRVIGTDVHGLDRDGDGVGCEGND